MNSFIHECRLLAPLYMSVALTLAGCGGGGDASTSNMQTALAVAPAVARVASSLSVSALVQTAQPVNAVITGPGWITASPNDGSALKAAYAPVFSGKAWYLDATAGNDANPGTLASPWKSLARTVNINLAAGDAVLLKCGEVFRGTLELTSVNAPAGNLLVGGYGDCSGERRPVIRASDWVAPTGWAKTGAANQAIYVRTYSQPVSRLFLSGKPLIKARYPNFQRVGAEFALTAPAPTATTTAFKMAAADLTALAGKDVVGATIYVKVKQWETIKAMVLAFDSGTGQVTLDHAMPFAIMPGSGYILEGKPWMLDSAGEWFFDEAAKQLYVWTPTGASPGLLEGLEASWRQYGLKAQWIKSLRVERLTVEQQDVDGFELIETTATILSDVKAMHVQELGISASTAPGVVIQDSYVESAGRSGIVARESDLTKVVRNHVVDNGGNARAWASDAAIAIFGRGSVAENNVVERSAGLGIRFANRADTVVRGNTVLSSCLRFTDCAAIYTYTGGAVAAMPATFVAGALVEGNVVVSARSNLEGCGYPCTNLAIGIYADELTSGVTLSGNTVSDTEIGIALLNGSFNHITGNLVRGSVASAFRGTKTRTETAVMRGNQVVGNSFFTYRGLTMSTAGVPVDAAPTNAQYWYHPSDATQLFAGVDRNVVTGNEDISVQLPGEVTWTFATASGSRVLKELDWRTYAPTDKQVSRVTYKQYVLTTEATLVSNGGFDPMLPASWRAYLNPVGSGGAFSMGNYLACGKNCGDLVAGSSSDYLESNTFSINGAPGQNLYFLSYAATGGTGGGLRRALVRRNVSPWENFGLSLPAVALAPGETTKVEAFFTATGSSNAAILDLRSAVNGQTYFTDVSLVRVRSIEFTALKQLMSHVVNPTAQALGFPCSSLGLSTCDLVDETGAQVGFPLTVPARSSRLVFAKDLKWLR